MSVAYLNGDFMPLAEARISPLDRGFTFGDGVYEVIPVYSRKPFLLDRHIRRLSSSLDRIFMTNPLRWPEWESILHDLIARNEGDDQSIYLQVTRGVSVRDHAIPDGITPTIFITSKPLHKPDYSQGISAITRKDIRWDWCDIKAITLLPAVLLRHEASQAGAREAVLIRDGLVTEGAASNLFICKNEEIKTPPKSNNILPGITRDLVIELLEQKNMPCTEASITKTELFQADEVWLTSSTQEIVPVIQLDGQPVGTGVPGPLWHKVLEFYQKYKYQLLE